MFNIYLNRIEMDAQTLYNIAEKIGEGASLYRTKDKKYKIRKGKNKFNDKFISRIIPYSDEIYSNEIIEEIGKNDYTKEEYKNAEENISAWKSYNKAMHIFWKSQEQQNIAVIYFLEKDRLLHLINRKGGSITNEKSFNIDDLQNIISLKALKREKEKLTIEDNILWIGKGTLTYGETEYYF